MNRHVWFSALLLLSLLSFQYGKAAMHLAVDEVKERLAKYYARNPPKCETDWANKYSSFHQKSIDQKDAQILVAVPNLSGLADRIIGLVTVCMFAMLTNRVFQVGHRDPLISLDTIFSAPNINWIRPPDEEWLLEPLKYNTKTPTYNNSILESKQYFAINTLDNWKLQDRFLRDKISSVIGDARISLIVMNRGRTIRIFENANHASQLKTMHLNASTTIGCIVHYLFQPKPSIFTHISEVFQRVTDATASENTLVIGIQIRAGDAYLSKVSHAIDLNQFGAFFDCALQIEEFALANASRYTSVKWLVASDSMPLRHEIVQKYGADKVITALHSPIEHSAKETSVCKAANCTVSPVGFQVAAAEWWLYSFAHYHVISQYSGFGRSAGMLSFYPNSIYTIPYKAMSKTITCSESSFTELLDLPYEWSSM
jgi:hypothetical protein